MPSRGAVAVRCSTVKRIHPSVNVHVIAVSAKKSSASAIGNVAVDDVDLKNYHYDDGNDSESDNAALFLLQTVVCAVVIEGNVGDGLCGRKAVLIVADVHFLISAAIETARPDVVSDTVGVRSLGKADAV